MSLCLTEAPRLPKALEGFLRPQRSPRDQGGSGDKGVRGSKGNKVPGSETKAPRLPKASEGS